MEILVIMLYFTVFLLLLVFSIREIVVRKPDKRVFVFLYVLLTCFLVLRQGQGTDYYNYEERIFNPIKENVDNSLLVCFSLTEPGFAILNIIAIKLGLEYKWFISIFSLITMCISWRFFSIHCRKSVFALLIFFSIGYLTYYFSVIRQGFAMAILMSRLPDCFKNKQWGKYCFIVMMASLFHLSAIISLIIPFVYRFKINRFGAILIVFLAVVWAVIGSGIIKQILPPFIASRMEADIYNDYNATRYLALIIRIIDIFPILLVDERVYKQYPMLRFLRTLLLCGFVLYAICSFNDIVASRINYYFRVFETLFAVELIRLMKLKKTHLSVSFIYVMLAIVLYVTNINASIDQGQYRDCNVLTYPYFSVFHDSSSISEYRLS